MRHHHLATSRLVRFVCFILFFAQIISPGARSNGNGANNGNSGWNGKQENPNVLPPQPGVPGPGLPNLDTMRTLSTHNAQPRLIQPNWCELEGQCFGQPPVADAGGPYSGAVQQNISFDGGNSYDPDGWITDYSWSFGDGGTGIGAYPAHSYASAGTYFVSLTVTDNNGQTGTANTSVVVGIVNQPPISNPGGPYNGMVSQNIPFNGSGSSAPGSSISSYSWNFGDSTTGSGSTPSKSYSAAGVYNATLTVTDNSGATNSATTSVTISSLTNQPPSAAPGGPYTVTVGQSLHFQGTGSDPDGTIKSYAWNFGDASSDICNVTFKNNCLGALTFNHVYQAAGVYKAILTVIDNKGAAASASVNVNVTGAGGSALTVNAGGPYNSDGGGLVQFSGSSSGGTNTTYVWNFGDNTYTSGLPNVSHRYAYAGTYRAVLTATGNGATGSATAIVNVTTADPSNNNFSMARLRPANRTGQASEDLLSGNCNWSLPILALPGRGGLSLGLTLNYNSRVWTRDGNAIAYNADRGFPGPGFRLGFPVIQQSFYNPEATRWSYLLITTSGDHVELRQTGTPGVYESVDSSSLQLVDNGNNTMILYSPNGTQMSYALYNNQYQCTGIKDRNGNFITASYDTQGHLSNITDTLNRQILFNYTNSRLSSVTQLLSNNQTRVWARFDYVNIGSSGFADGLNVIYPSGSIYHINNVYLSDGSRFNFLYASYGQVMRIIHYAADAHILAYTTYTYPSAFPPLSDFPRVTDRRDWAENWNMQNGAATEAVTTFAYDANGAWGQATLPTPIKFEAGNLPNGAAGESIVEKELFDNSSTWRKGLTTVTETRVNGVLKRATSLTWEQDGSQQNPNLAYRLNPRVTETNVYDYNNQGQQLNRRRNTTAYTTYGLPSDVTEYNADAATILRHTQFFYNLDPAYISRRIIGLISEQRLYQGSGTGTLMAKTAYLYDDPGTEYLQAQGATIPQHDSANYNTSLRWRGNQTRVQRYNVNNQAQFTETSTGYNTTGSVIWARDALQRKVDISYSDNFSNKPDSGTLAYPTKATDPDQVMVQPEANRKTTRTEYDYNTGAVTKTIAVTGAGVQTEYDSIGRPLKQTEFDKNGVFGAYTRWVYPASQIIAQSFARIDTNLPEAYSATVFDGAGRTRATAGTLPNSIGGYVGQYFEYDVMGRVVKQSNPTEMNSDWVASGDDAAGWYYGYQSFDWKGRPLVTTNTDGTTRYASYEGCGCAGGATVTLLDEGTTQGSLRRKQKMSYDAADRLVKTEVFNWENGSVYSTIQNYYNVRDQVTLKEHYQGEASASNPRQEYNATYDGFGRLSTHHVPIQDPAKFDSFVYNPDDTIQSVTDARQVQTGYSYNARKQITQITYTKLPGDNSAIPNTPPVNFTYDAEGNRTLMTDGLGSVSYTYDQYSRLASETRYFSELNRSYQFTYGYNQADQVTSIGLPFSSQQIGYSYDSTGRLAAVTGSGFTNTSYTQVLPTAQPVTQSITSFAAGMRSGPGNHREKSECRH